MTRTLAWRVTASCLVVALVAVAVAAVVALRLVSVTTRQVTQQILGQQADVVAAQLDGTRPARVIPVLRSQGVDVVMLGTARANGVLATVLTRAGADRALAGTNVSVDGRLRRPHLRRGGPARRDRRVRAGARDGRRPAGG